MCIHLPQWSITRRFRRHREYLAAPIAVIETIHRKRVVVDASQAAYARGVRPGISAAEAAAVCPNLVCIDQDCLADLRALDALGRWLIRFTPVVARGWEDADPNLKSQISNPRQIKNQNSKNHNPPLFLDLSGCERLFGGLKKLVGMIMQSLDRFGIPARLAIAPTPGAAWAFASAGEKRLTYVDAASLPDAIQTLPVSSLRIDDEILRNLHQLGLQSVGQILKLPREQIPARFGPLLLKRIDQLAGTLPEPLTKLVYEAPISAKMQFDAPIESLEDIWRIFEKLLALTLKDLARRNHGVRRMRVICHPDRDWGKPIILREISVTRPHRDWATLLNLLRCEIERMDCEYGFVQFQLDIPLHEPLNEMQVDLFDQQSVEDQVKLDRLLERLGARLGKTCVIRPELVESYLPERAWKPAVEEPAKVMMKLPPRPLTLLPTPREIRVICEPSDDRGGKPRQLTWRNEVHRLTHVVGPERIAGEWWRGHHKVRDYYDVENESGSRFWIFRVVRMDLGSRWFMQGMFG